MPLFSPNHRTEFANPGDKSPWYENPYKEQSDPRSLGGDEAISRPRVQIIEEVHGFNDGSMNRWFTRNPDKFAW